MKTLINIFCCLILAACSKDNTAGNKTDLLTAHPWKLKTVIITPGLRATSRDTAFSDRSPDEPCDMDNPIQFFKDGTASIKSGALQCVHNEVPSITGAWRFINDGEKLWLRLKGVIGNFGYIYDTVYTINELTESSLKFNSTYYWSNTRMMHTRVETFVK